MNTQTKTCLYCNNTCQNKSKLCINCYDLALSVITKHYDTSDLSKLISMAKEGGCAISFRYKTNQKKINKNTDGGEFIVDNWDNMSIICNYGRTTVISEHWINVSTEDSFWSQFGG